MWIMLLVKPTGWWSLQEKTMTIHGCQNFQLYIYRPRTSPPGVPCTCMSGHHTQQNWRKSLKMSKDDLLKQSQASRNTATHTAWKKLRLPTLAYQCQRGDMLKVFKLTSGLYDHTFLMLFKDSTAGLQGHNKTYSMRDAIKTWENIPSVCDQSTYGIASPRKQ